MDSLFKLMADAAPVLMWMAGEDALCTFFSRGWLEFTGRTMGQELGDGWAEGVHPEDLDRTMGTYLGSFERREPFEMEYRLRRSDGAWRWILHRGVPLWGPDGGFSGYIGACIDITARRDAEEELRRSREELRLALAAGGMGTWVWDRASGVVTRDAGLDAIYGLEASSGRGDFDGWVDLVHPDDRAWVLRLVEKAIDEGGTYDFEHRIVRPDGSVRWVERRGESYRNEDGEVAGSRGLVVDVTERKLGEAERERLLAAEQEARRAAEELAQRLANLQAVTADLADARTSDQVASVIVERATEALGALSGAVCLVSDDGQSMTVISHVGYHPGAVERFETFSIGADLPASDALRTGEMVLLRTLAERDERYPVLAGMPALSHAFATVPLFVGRSPLGAIALGWAHPREFDDEDRRFLLALGQHAAQALDRAQFYEAEHRTVQRQTLLASTLQQSLLPLRVPLIPGLEVAARYHPVGDGSEVGGDFYDVFAAGGGRWGVVMGDVSGKGVLAASLTALARYTTRTAAGHERRPSAVLAVVNDAILDHDVGERFATIAHGLIEHSAAGVTVELCLAGHPPPLLLDAKGAVRPLGRAGTAVGLFHRPTLHDDRHVLRPGQALVFYTDGLLEARSPEGTFAEGLLERTLATCAGASAAAIAGTIEKAMLEFQGGRPRDDMALVVVRLPPGIFHRRLSPTPEVVSSTRGVLRSWLADQGPHVLGVADDVLLVVSELTTNAMRMARRDVQLYVWVDAHEVNIDVYDDGPGFDRHVPVPGGEPNPWALEGRGLRIVGSLVDQCTVQSGPSATLVRCTKRL